MKAPFPWFGGKSRVAHLVWDRFGDVPNYVEPFAGSLAVLLGRPTDPRIETVNDLDCLLSNFWRAVQADPEAVAKWADWPINEADLHARHIWIVNQLEFREHMKTDPEFFDAKIAGWWVWGICQWIGSGWCSKPEWRGRGNASMSPRGIEAMCWRKRPNLRRGANGVHRKMPLIGEREAGRGVLNAEPSRQIPNLSGDAGASGRGIHASGSETPIGDWMRLLQNRLRRVRVCCGDWKRILGPSPTTKIGMTGVFLDPPYSADRVAVYNEESFDVARDAHAWALANGDNPDLRIAVCGYEGEASFPESWETLAWKAPGGYGNQGKNTAGRDNAKLERIWFSPHCLNPTQALLPLFESGDFARPS